MLIYEPMGAIIIQITTWDNIVKTAGFRMESHYLYSFCYREVYFIVLLYSNI